MNQPMVSEDVIKTQAREAAGKYTNVNDACPYPFHSAAGQIFKEEFAWVRSMLDLKHSELQEHGR